MSQAKPAVGIDLGTTFSVVSYLDGEGKPHTIQNAEGDLTTPSVVYFGEAETVAGKEAVKVAQFEPKSIAQFAKRDIGKSQFHKVIRGTKMPPEAIQALILKKLREDAALKIGEFTKVVITVPAFFNEPRRKATMDAGALAGLEVLDIINEPTAAAIAYGVQEGFVSVDGRTDRRETIVVYDLGGGTFDVTLMEIDGKNYRALSTGGDVHLGGIDWDERIVDHLAEAFQEQFGDDLRRNSEALSVLRHEAEDAKRALSTRENVAVHVADAGRRLKLDLTREQLESMTEDLLQRTVFTVNKVLREGKRSWDDVTRLLLVGGSTRMPMIQTALLNESGKAPDRTLSPDEAVAHGAALYAGFLSNPDPASHPQLAITNVSSHDLGVLGVEPGTGLKRRHVIISRNTPLPAEGKSKFSTRHENQLNVKVQVVEGGDASGTNSTEIGRCVVTDLPAKLPAGSPVIVEFAYATNGRLTVEASLAKASQQATMVVERASGLSDRMVKQWKQWIRDGALIAPSDEPEELDDEPTFEMLDETEPASEPASTLDQIEEVEFEDDVTGLDFDDEIEDVEFVDEELAEIESVEEIAQIPPQKPAKPPIPTQPASEESNGGLDSIDDSQIQAPTKRGEAPGDWSFLDGS